MGAMKALILIIILLITFCQSILVAQIGDDGTGIVNGLKIGPNEDLRGADLKGTNLKGANLMRANLENADLQGANLENAILQGTNLSFSNLKNSNLDGASLERAIVINADISSASLIGTIFSRAVMSNSNFNNSNLTRALFFNSNLGDVDFTGANLFQVVSGFIVGTPKSLPSGWMLSIDGSFLVGYGADLRTADLTNTRYLGSVLTSLTKEAFEKINVLESKLNDKEDEISELNQSLDLMNQKIQQIADQISEFQAAIIERDQQIVDLEKRPTLDQIRDARAGSILFSLEPDQNRIELGISLEESDNLMEWTKLEGEMKKSIPIPDTKKFYRFAFD